MKLNIFKTFTLLITLVITGFCLSACSETPSGGDAPVKTGDIKLPQVTGEEIIGNDLVNMDISNTNEGYICIKYNGDADNVKLQIRSDDQTYTYNLETDGQYATFPFSCGNGTYGLQVYENLWDNQYAQVCGENVDVVLDDETLPFLYPNNYVNYDSNSQVIALTQSITADSQTQLQLVEDVYKYVVDKIDYDYDKAQSISEGYVPDLDQIVETHKGICFDYAALMTAMLRISNIPAKLVIGYNGDVYHSWISVYISDVGWVDNAIEFDGAEWTLMDPTYAASSQAGRKADYVDNEDQYHALYFY